MKPGSEHLRSALLVHAYREGDDAALAKLVAMWERPLFYYLRRLVETEEDAWDALQEVWRQVVEKIGSLRDPLAWTAWVYRIAHHTAANHTRQQITAERHQREAAAFSDIVDEPFATAFNAEEVHYGLGKLSIPQREALMLHFLEGFSLAEIAAIVDVPIGTVKSRLHHAKKELRLVLEKEEEHHE